MTPTVKQIKEEADNLKLYTNQEELSKLDFDNLFPFHEDNCIYGQMTGNCFSPRATELLNLCTKPYSHHLSSFDNKELNESFDNIQNINNRPFSPIEYFIAFKYDNHLINNKILIDYLKGKRKTLRFKSFN